MYVAPVVPLAGGKCHSTFAFAHSANMQVITAIYLNCRPDLRDEWLTGIEVDDVYDAQVSRGLEWSLKFVELTSCAGARASVTTPGEVLYVLCAPLFVRGSRS